MARHSARPPQCLTSGISTSTTRSTSSGLKPVTEKRLSPEAVVTATARLTRARSAGWASATGSSYQRMSSSASALPASIASEASMRPWQSMASSTPGPIAARTAEARATPTRQAASLPLRTRDAVAELVKGGDLDGAKALGHRGGGVAGKGLGRALAERPVDVGVQPQVSRSAPPKRARIGTPRLLPRMSHRACSTALAAVRAMRPPSTRRISALSARMSKGERPRMRASMALAAASRSRSSPLWLASPRPVIPSSVRTRRKTQPPLSRTRRLAPSTRTTTGSIDVIFTGPPG